MTPLTGPPRFAGTLRPLPSLEGWMECYWDDSESVWDERRGGLLVLMEPKHRLRGSATWSFLTEAEAASFLPTLRSTFLVCPRTRLPSDPADVVEVEVPCRRTSPLPATTALYRTDPTTGRPVWVLELSFESVATYPHPLPFAEAAFPAAAGAPYSGYTYAL